MKVLIDTNVLSELEFLRWLRAVEDVEKYMSTVTLMEFAYHLLKKGKGEGRLKAFIDLYSISSALFDEESAVIAARSASKKWDFGERARDYFPWLLRTAAISGMLSSYVSAASCSIFVAFASDG